MFSLPYDSYPQRLFPKKQNKKQNTLSSQTKVLGLGV